MDIENFKKYLLSVIPNSRPASGGKAIMCRCFECPDSSDPTSAHFYFLFPENGKHGPINYYCHKCNCKGVVTYEKLIEWDIYDPDIGQELIEYNKNVKSDKRYKSQYDSGKIYNVYSNFTTDDDTSRFKLDYSDTENSIVLSTCYGKSGTEYRMIVIIQPSKDYETIYY